MYLYLFINLSILTFLVWFIYGWARSSISGAPFVPTFTSHVRPLLELGNLKPDDVLYDLGCGNGKILTAAVRDFGVRRAVGIEISPLPLALARLRLATSGLDTRVSVIRGDMRKVPLEEATVIFTYLLTQTMDGLATHLATARAGTRIISAAFPLDLNHHPEFRLIRQVVIGRINGYLYERI